MKKTKMLKKNYEFKNVLSKGKYFSGDYIESFIKKNKNIQQNLLGIAISVKIGKAVRRNKIKRLIKENYKDYESNIKTGNSIVFLWKKKVDTKNATFKNIQHDFNIIFNKAKLFIEENNEKNINIDN